MLSDKSLPSESNRTVHSHEVAINIKITLLNNKYISDYGDIGLFEVSVSPHISELPRCS